MKTTDEETQTLANQLKKWNVQIAMLALKQQTATETAKLFTKELDELRLKHQTVTQQLKELALHESGMYMWENIGDGG